MNTSFSEADMLRLALLGDEEMSLLGQILYDQGKKLKDDKKRFEEAQKKQEKIKQQKKIKRIQIPDAEIYNLFKRKHKSDKFETKHDTTTKQKSTRGRKRR